MEGYEASTYGDRIADIYDDFVEGVFDVESTVDLLAELAREGPVLELAIGTGRIALPLAAKGVDVHGIDVSEAMVEKLRAKPRGADIPVTIGDFADVSVDHDYALIFVVFNTLFALTTQEDQVRCFRNVADHLTPDGAFVLEAFVPDVARFDRNQRMQTDRVGLDEVRIEASRHDPVSQRVESQHIFVGRAGVRMYPVHIRYSWPSELDLMARIAGLKLRERWGGWRREPFDSNSTSHVSVYERGDFKD